MITSIILILIALGWLFWETDWMRVRLPTGKDKPVDKSDVKCQGSISAMPCPNNAEWVNQNGVKVCEHHKLLLDAFTWESRHERQWTRLVPEPDKPIDKSVPYWWQTNKDNLMLCQNCQNKCRHDKERWIGWKLPARTVRAWGSVMNFNEGCNIGRAKILRDIAGIQNKKSHTVSLRGEQIYHRSDDSISWGYIEPSIDILVDGELKASFNGDYKRGMIASTLKPYTKTIRAGKKTITVTKDGEVVDCGGGVYIAVNK